MAARSAVPGTDDGLLADELVERAGRIRAASGALSRKACSAWLENRSSTRRGAPYWVARRISRSSVPSS